MKQTMGHGLQGVAGAELGRIQIFSCPIPTVVLNAALHLRSWPGNHLPDTTDGRVRPPGSRHQVGYELPAPTAPPLRVCAVPSTSVTAPLCQCAQPPSTGVHSPPFCQCAQPPLLPVCAARYRSSLLLPACAALCRRLHAWLPAAAHVCA